jgi:hypothetical protein
MDQEPQPIVVSANAGLIDAVTAAARYIVVIVGFITAVLGLFKTRDIAGLIAYIQSNGGEVLAAVAGLVSIGTAAYGIFKTRKRGAQVATVAGSTKVPDSVASLKE